MSGFIYYAPKALTPAEFERLRPDVFQGAGLERRGCVKGPDGGEGFTLTIQHPHKAQTAYQPDSQHWMQPAGCAWWLGVQKDGRPGPADLQRTSMLAGHSVKLADGNTWTIPQVYLAGPLGENAAPIGRGLPQAMTLTPDGIQYETAAEYSWLQDITQRFWRFFMSQGKEDVLDDATLYRMCAEALRWNYHLGVEEINLLRLLDTVCVIAVGRALIDWPGFEALLNETQEARVKNSPAGGGDTSDTASGETDTEASQPARISSAG